MKSGHVSHAQDRDGTQFSDGLRGDAAPGRCVEAFSATESTVGDLYLGGLPSVSIWVKDAAQVRDACEILQQVQAQQTRLQCPACDYDLRGHSGKATCPECGESITANSADRQCPQCGETVPHDFEICWNCGADC